MGSRPARPRLLYVGLSPLFLGLPSDEAEQVWVWEYETEEGAHDLYMDIGEEVRFRVVDESFVDTSPTGPSSAEAASSSEELPKKEAPYTLMGSISEPGLGLLSWWTSS